MLAGIHALPAGHVLDMRTGHSPVSTRYFEFERNEPCNDLRSHGDRVEPVDSARWVADFQQRFRTSVLQRLSD